MNSGDGNDPLWIYLSEVANMIFKFCHVQKESNHRFNGPLISFDAHTKLDSRLFQMSDRIYGYIRYKCISIRYIAIR